MKIFQPFFLSYQQNDLQYGTKKLFRVPKVPIISNLSYICLALKLVFIRKEKAAIINNLPLI